MWFWLFSYPSVLCKERYFSSCHNFQGSTECNPWDLLDLIHREIEMFDIYLFRRFLHGYIGVNQCYSSRNRFVACYFFFNLQLSRHECTCLIFEGILCVKLEGLICFEQDKRMALKHNWWFGESAVPQLTCLLVFQWKSVKILVCHIIKWIK